MRPNHQLLIFAFPTQIERAELRVKIIACTPNPDLIAGAVTRGCLSTKSAAELLESKEEKKLKKALKTAVGRGHYSVLEHNRALWLVEGASKREILLLSAKHKFLEISRIGDDAWVLSANLRTVLEMARSEKNELVDKLVGSMRRVSTTFAELIR